MDDGSGMPVVEGWLGRKTGSCVGGEEDFSVLSVSSVCFDN
jgi:hypothetical protein